MLVIKLLRVCILSVILPHRHILSIYGDVTCNFFFRWDSQGYFRPNFDRGSDPFVISMPPPNVTGSLHMGHAMFVTLEVGKIILYSSIVQIHLILCN